MNLNATTEDMLTAIRVLGGEGTTVEWNDHPLMSNLPQLRVTLGFDKISRALGYNPNLGQAAGRRDAARNMLVAVVRAVATSGIKSQCVCGRFTYLCRPEVCDHPPPPEPVYPDPNPLDE